MRSKMFPLILGGLLTLGAGAAIAQDNPPPPPQQGQPVPPPRRMNPERQLRHLTRQLNLTGDQRKQIKPLLEERRNKMQALFANQNLSPEDRRAQARAVAADIHARIVAVLNDQQKQEFEAMQQRRRGGPLGPPPPPPDSSTQPQQ